jgi:peptidyl-tRNA hydrolase, PTH1 family
VSSLKLIIGLGNPGERYQYSRHNIGFLVVDRLANDHHISLNQKGFDACFGRGKILDTPVFLAKPQTFMNLSGNAVRKLIDYFKIDSSDVIVVHDDLDLPFSDIRIKTGGGHAGHKGLISIINHLGGTEFPRVRLGIGKPPIKSMTEEYVLHAFGEEEMKDLSDIVIAGSNALTEIIVHGVQSAMNHYNKRIPELNNLPDT